MFAGTRGSCLLPCTVRSLARPLLTAGGVFTKKFCRLMPKAALNWPAFPDAVMSRLSL